ncbi:hypothetical protein MKW98_011162 [Papaver atlanticum]|uniref:Uncharacterized protein n=1 Tax=Papaver atlanticum TaxID=357466 RepID=A0AAD4TKA5_9MAGN|nr:hypothetical protein MKW98_011162 [Papaver atlanticum]
MRAPVACLAVEPIGTSPSCFPEQGSITRQCEFKLAAGPALILLLIGLVPYTFGVDSNMCSRIYKVEVKRQTCWDGSSD